ncbi:MAG: SGNH/GDSL hydrolase family protein [Bacteroidales bacterium]|nr:SGNH/GDSL hydrolase family protein [Bacteroidales bacterium]
MKRMIFVAAALVVFSLGLKAQENPVAEISRNPGWCTIFHKWGFIGDSLCSGEHEYNRADGNRGYNDIYEYSWGQRMVAAIGGATGDNYSQGGETAKGWIDHFWDNPCNRNADVDAKSDPKQAYIIALGENDLNTRIAPGDASKDVNMDDYTKNADTFIGYYAGIIQRVKSIQPKARFFVVTMPVGHFKAKEPYNAQIRRMTELFDNVYLIDLEKYAPEIVSKEFMSRYFVMGHMNAAGYQWTAWVFMTYIDWIIDHNMKDFADVAFVR